MKGKKKAFTVLDKNEGLQAIVSVFNNQNARHDEIAAAGEEFLKQLYGCKVTQTLDRLRYYIYKRTVAKQPLHSKFDLATLPPTSAAARQHSYRVYHQVQQWRGIELQPTDWGWKQSQLCITPIPSLQEVAPVTLLQLVSCNCKGDCSTRCDCRRGGLECTGMCGQCHGESCANIRAVIENDDDSDNEINEASANDDSDTESDEPDH